MINLSSTYLCTVHVVMYSAPDKKISVSRELSNYLIIITQQSKFRGIRKKISALLQTDSFWNELSFQEIICTQRSGSPECFTR